MSGFECAVCGFRLWHPICELGVSSLGFYDDERFPGRCLLTFRRHVEHLTEVSEGEAAAFIRDSQAAARAILDCTRADRINYAILGNTEPHLHMHLIPRVQSTDPIPTRPPWEHPEEKRPMEPEAAQALVRAIAAGIRC